ncbi:hypothetical protein JHK86_009816 [Glycine max]|nr:hypothetical protein JHK86_009816 [Glycine max]
MCDIIHFGDYEARLICEFGCSFQHKLGDCFLISCISATLLILQIIAFTFIAQNTPVSAGFYTSLKYANECVV